jgi:hypothetical protein
MRPETKAMSNGDHFVHGSVWQTCAGVKRGKRTHSGDRPGRSPAGRGPLPAALKELFPHPYTDAGESPQLDRPVHTVYT